MQREQILNQVKTCDITYHVPGETDRSAMPIGNGELCASVWADREGYICMYLSRSDAKTECDRTVKLGMVKFMFSPNPFCGQEFRQSLHLTEGCIRIEGKGGYALVWIERQTDILRMSAFFDPAVCVAAEYVNWRTEDHVPDMEFHIEGGIAEKADVIEKTDSGVLFFHENGETVIPATAKLEGLGDCMDMIPDQLTGRIFGGMLAGEKTEYGWEYSIATYSAQTDRKMFQSVLEEKLRHLCAPEESRKKTADFWEEYWTKSYIFVENDPKMEKQKNPELEACSREPMEYTCECSSDVTLAYTLTKYMTACCAEGAFPMLYNGQLFNLCPGKGEHFNTQNFAENFTSQPEDYTLDVNPDERTWAVEQLWQNLRHPYHSLCARGEAESMKPLFEYFRRFRALNRARAEKYYGAQGTHNTEMTMSFGLQSMDIYGIDRTGKPDGYAQNRWGGAVDISPGLELCSMMLDYYDFTSDSVFLKETALPMLYELLLYIATRFPERKDGLMRIGPLNSVETYRDTINPIPVVAGIRSCLKRVLALRADLVEKREWFLEYEKMVPPIPAAEILLPAEEYEDVRYNVEVPELYAIFPFRNYGFEESELELAKKTYYTRIREFGIDKVFHIGDIPGTPSYSGWQYTGMAAALLGLKEEAGKILSDNCSLSNPGTRFPAMWGPFYDAVPDTDHGANILNQLQTMILQVHEGKVYLLKGFPEEWNVRFRLYINSSTGIEGEFINGRCNFTLFQETHM